MNQYTANHFQKTAAAMRDNHSGHRITLKWRIAHTAEYDSSRDEYESNTGEEWLSLQDVPCIIYQVSRAFLQQQWGNAEVGDLIVAIDPAIETEDRESLRVVFMDMEYKVVPNSIIPATRLSGVIANTALSKILHCRFSGES